MTNPRNGPVLIEIEDSNPSPAEAEPVLDADISAPTGQAMQTMAVLAARPSSVLSRWFWRLLGTLVAFGLSVWAYDFVAGLVLRNPILGYAALGLLALFLAVCIAIVFREWAALSRLSRLDKIHEAAETAQQNNDMTEARSVAAKISALYAGRDDMRWGQDRVRERSADAVDADTLFQVIETDLIAPLDAAATREVEAAARQVATVTALVPIALADVVAALTANLRMIRRISEIYGGRSGALGAWRLTRTVLSHLVATGAVAVGDDLISSVAGGGILSKVSRRFGEGLINGALTARVGVAAMEVSRPLPFGKERKPSVTGIVRRSLTGLFANSSK